MKRYYLITVPNGQTSKKFLVENLIGLEGKFPLFFVELIDVKDAENL